MSRDIKFRFWHKEKNEWHGKGVPLYKVNLPDYGTDYEVEQYTGLKDKNGVEIYEGDIICAHGKFFTSVDDLTESTLVNPKYKVEYRYAMFLLVNIDYDGGTMEIDRYHSILEVIGNIHENI